MSQILLQTPATLQLFFVTKMQGGHVCSIFFKIVRHLLVDLVNILIQNMRNYSTDFEKNKLNEHISATFTRQ